MDTGRFPAIVAAMVAALLLASSCNAAWPVITGVEAEGRWAAPLDSLQVTCIASNPAADALNYEWSTTGGSITGTGPEVVWTAPEAVGMYDITVTVENGQGRKDTASIVLIGSNGPPPAIESLIVTADHRYLKEATAAYKVLKNEEYAIECVASNTSDELVYEWSCDDGEISGGGSMITWTAPYTAFEIDTTVTVRVIDGIGNWVRESVVFEVVYCPSCVNW